MTATDSYFYLKELTIEKIIHMDWGPLSFQEFTSKVTPLRNMALKMGEILESNSAIPNPIVQQANFLINNIFDRLDAMSKFNLTKSIEAGNGPRLEFMKEISEVFNAYLTGVGSADPISDRFLTTYTTILTFNRDFEEDNKINVLTQRIDKLKEDFDLVRDPMDDEFLKLKTVKAEFDALLTELQQKGKEKTTEDYAEVFKNVATKNKESSIFWLIICSIALVLFVVFIPYENQLIPIDTKSGATVITFEYLKRLLIISFFIYVISFLIKQYSIKKHLETLNTHRQNTLNSYNLFLKSMGAGDQDVKNALMVEVARAIYESGQTGYINSKDDGGTNSSIMEITKFMKPSA